MNERTLSPCSFSNHAIIFADFLSAEIIKTLCTVKHKTANDYADAHSHTHVLRTHLKVAKKQQRKIVRTKVMNDERGKKFNSTDALKVYIFVNGSASNLIIFF